MPLVLTEKDYDRLREETGVPVPRLKAMLATEDLLHDFRAEQLKNIIRFLKTKTKLHINVTGRKQQLVDNIASVLFSSGTFPAYPSPSSSSLSSSSSSFPNPLSSSGSNITVEHNTHIPSSSSSSLSSSQNSMQDTSLNDMSFVDRQSPFYEQKKQLGVFPFSKHESVFQEKAFLMDAASYEAVKNKTGQVHVRFYNKERGCDIPWNVDVRLLINGHDTDLSKLARKIRSKPFSNPFILPRPADITSYVRTNNVIKFIHPGEYGVLIVQLVRERPMSEMIAIVQQRSSHTVNAITKSTNNDDVLEVNYMLSLRCPLSYMRISTPSKSKSCAHAQCFDLKSYLEYSHQQQLWQCPVCTQRCPFHDLTIDSRFNEILNSVPEEEKVIIHPDGSFEVPPPPTDPKIKRSESPEVNLKVNGADRPSNGNTSSDSHHNNTAAAATTTTAATTTNNTLNNGNSPRFSIADLINSDAIPTNKSNSSNSNSFQTTLPPLPSHMFMPAATTTTTTKSTLNTSTSNHSLSTSSLQPVDDCIVISDEE